MPAKGNGCLCGGYPVRRHRSAGRGRAGILCSTRGPRRGVGWGYRAGRWYTGTHPRARTAPAHPRLDDGTSRAARRQARCVDQASVNSGQTDTRRQTPEGGGTGGVDKPTMSPQL